MACALPRLLLPVLMVAAACGRAGDDAAGGSGFAAWVIPVRS